MSDMETLSRTARSLSDAVAKEIRIALIRLDMKQSDLAARMNKSEMWVSRRLRGAQPIDLNDLQEFADALGIAAEGLITAASPQADHATRTNARSSRPAERPTLSGQRQRAEGRESTRRPARKVPFIPALMTDDAMAEFLDAAAA